jgi:hypothetical protein
MVTRRKFSQVCSLSLMPVICFAQAASLKLSTSEPLAKAAGYALKVSDVDKSKYPGYAVGQTCGVCKFYLGSPSDEWAGCVIFSGKLVSRDGWCNTFKNR